MAENPPADVSRLALERAEVRARRDFARADELRALIGEAGWEVVDGPGGAYELRPVGPAEVVERIRVSAGARPPAPPPEGLAVSVVLDLEGWPDDAARFVASLDRWCHLPEGDIEVVAVDRSAETRSSPSGPSTAWLGGWSGPARVLVPDADPGFGAARNAALWRAAGRVAVFVDTSIELTGDLLGAVVGALADPGVAVAGPYGLITGDLRDYEERVEGDVAAVQGYCLAARRADLLAAGGVADTFTYYRNADIDVSLRLRALGGEVRRAVAVGADQSRRHAHSAWEATPPEERERLSRRNMRRVHDRFGGRLDLAVR